MGEEEREKGGNRLVAGILDAYSDRFHQLPGSSPLPSIPPQRTAPSFFWPAESHFYQIAIFIRSLFLLVSSGCECFARVGETEWKDV